MTATTMQFSAGVVDTNVLLLWKFLTDSGKNVYEKSRYIVPFMTEYFMLLTFENWEHRGEGNAGAGPAPSVPVPRLQNNP